MFSAIGKVNCNSEYCGIRATLDSIHRKLQPIGPCDEVLFNMSYKKLLLKEQVPAVFQVDYILTGYRYPYSTLPQAIGSAFTIHNETINFWTHFIPLWFVLYKIYHLQLSDSYWHPLLIFLISHGMCYFWSSTAHLLSSMSAKVCQIMFVIDYSAISAVCMGCNIASSYYYGPHYISATSIIVSTALISLTALVVTARFSSNNTRNGCLKIIAISLLFISNSSITYLKHFTTGLGPTLVYHLLGTLSMSITGLAYAAKIPERFFPKKFDIFCSSHQLFHLFTILTFSVVIYTFETDAILYHVELRNKPMPNFNTTFAPFIGFLAAEWLIIYFYSRQL